jgi:hypothetical protein
MIQTKQPIVYGARNDKNGIILVEVRPLMTTDLGTNYLVNDWAKVGDELVINNAKEVFYTNAQIDGLDAYIEENFQPMLTGLSKTEKEWKKRQIALMIDTQTNLLPTGTTIYGLSPNDWEFTPDKK